MKELTIINEQQVLGKHFAIYGTPEEPLFLAKDVAEWIEYEKSSINKLISSVDEGEKLLGTILRAGQSREAWFLTEDGLYEVLMQSRKPIAKKFKKEVKQILKSIRRHGLYAVDELLSNPDLAIRAFTALKEERAKNGLLTAEIERQNQIIGELRPRADYTDKILQNPGLVTITQIAKDYGMSGRAMNRMLAGLGVQYKQSGQWLLYRKYHDKGYTHSKTIEIIRADGSPDVVMETKWTQNGRLFLYELLKENGVLPLIETAA